MSRKFIFGGSYASAFVYDVDAQNYFNANTAITLDADKLAINDFYLGLKADGIYTKLKAMYFPKWASAVNNKWNLLNPVDSNAAFRLSFIGGWTHALTGATPNGTNGYADTFFVPSANQTLNSNGLGMALRTNITETSADPVNMGAFLSIAQASTCLASNSQLTSRMNGGLTSSALVNKIGFYSAQRTSATVTTNYKDGSSVATSNSGGNLPTVNVYLGTLDIAGAPYASGYTKNEFIFAFMSDGLNAAENLNLYNRFNTLKTYFGL